MGCSSSAATAAAPPRTSSKRALAARYPDDGSCCSDGVASDGVASDVSTSCPSDEASLAASPARAATVHEDDVTDFFDEQQRDASNRVCVDTGASNPTWADVSHGVYLGIEASGIHRSLGRSICCVRSLEMDRWSEDQLQLMRIGGNRRFRDAMRGLGVPDDMPIRQQYSTVAANWYRQCLQAELRGEEPPAPPVDGARQALDGDSRSQQLLSEAF